MSVNEIEASTDAHVIDEASGENYLSFLLRCWQEADAGAMGKAGWRFTLVKLDSNQRKRGFASVAALFTYLEQEFGVLPLQPGSSQAVADPD